MQPSAWNVDFSNVNVIQPAMLLGCWATQTGFNFTTILEGKLKQQNKKENKNKEKKRKKNPERHPNANLFRKIDMLSVSVL